MTECAIPWSIGSEKMKYRLDELMWQQFEGLCSEICVRILGEGFVNFANGKDAGKDGKFEGKANSFPSEEKPYEGKFIVQSKHTTNPTESCSGNSFDVVINKEVPKIKKLHANDELNHYFLLTNRKLTGGYEGEFQRKIKKEVPGITALIWGKERIHLFLDNNTSLHDKFGFNNLRSPLEIRPEDLKKIIEKFRDYIPHDSSSEENVGKDFNYTVIDKKNSINKLSNNYYKYIKENSEKHFHSIKNFLENPRNETYRKMYNDTAYDFKGVIISRRHEYDNFDGVLEDLFTRSYSTFKGEDIDKALLKVFIHFMYFSCDIGEKED